ncbi:MAG: hypothetical protein JST86_10085 [Bacteroidetes bacterium]|nr:hypothetical protein [Bacteroidota bacterium]
MKQIFSYISTFRKEGYNGLYFLFIIVMLAVLIYFNYGHQLTPKIDQYKSNFVTGWILYYLLYLIPFALGFLLQRPFFKTGTYWRNRWFWIILLSAPAIFAFRVNFSLGQTIIPASWGEDDIVFGSNCLNLLVRAVVIIAAVWIIWLVKDRKTQPFYGTQKSGPPAPYLLMILIMLPLIIIAATQKDFLHMYPRVKFLLHTAEPQPSYRYWIYEICYGFDFVSIELFFRGFLVLSLLRICGTQCIVPMACFYCSIHLGKPAGEAVSSFWGGLLLGIVSYHTRSIRGGLVVHLGIAWLMEICGWLALLFTK